MKWRNLFSNISRTSIFPDMRVFFRIRALIMTTFNIKNYTTTMEITRKSRKKKLKFVRRYKKNRHFIESWYLGIKFYIYMNICRKIHILDLCNFWLDG